MESHRTKTIPMPSFFSFQQGSESSHLRYTADASPLLGRFRAVPRPEHTSPRRSGLGAGNRDSQSRIGLLSAGWRGSVHVGYGAVLARELDEDDEDEYDDDDIDEDDEDGEGHIYYEKGGLARLAWWCRRWARRMEDTWVTPRASAVKRTVDLWWSRWAVLVVLPASLVSFPNTGCQRERDDEIWESSIVANALISQ